MKKIVGAPFEPERDVIAAGVHKPYERGIRFASRDSDPAEVARVNGLVLPTRSREGSENRSSSPLTYLSSQD